MKTKPLIIIILTMITRKFKFILRRKRDDRDVTVQISFVDTDFQALPLWWRIQIRRFRPGSGRDGPNRSIINL